MMKENSIESRSEESDYHSEEIGSRRPHFSVTPTQSHLPQFQDSVYPFRKNNQDLYLSFYVFVSL